MRSRTLQTVLALLVTVFAAAGCDPVRTGDYSGTYPPPVHVDLAQAPDVAALEPGGTLMFRLKTWSFKPVRRWAYGGLRGGVAPGDISPTGFAVDAWWRLAEALGAGVPDDPVDRTLTLGVLELMGSPASTFESAASQPGLLAVDLSHVLAVATADMDVALAGPSGPTVHIPAGFHAYARTCTADGPLSFTEVPTNTVLQPVQMGWLSLTATADWMSLTGGEPTDFAVASCMIAGPPPDLGTVAAPIPPDPTTTTNIIPESVGAMAWSPTSEGVYLAVQNGTFPTLRPAGWLTSVHIAYLGIGQSTTIPITSTDLTEPPSLAVATGGTSLLLWTKFGGYWQYLRQSLSSSLTPAQAALPANCCSQPEAPNNTVLSPDGNLLASKTPAGTLSLTDLVNLSSSALALPAPYRCVDGCSVVPRAFAPNGAAILLELWNLAEPEVHTFATVALSRIQGQPPSVGDLALLPTVGLPAPLARGSTEAEATIRYFWSASGPQALLQDAEGARVYNLVTQQTSLIVEPNRVATARRTIDAVAATDQAFAWAVRCFGLGETSCQTELRRLSLATGAIDVVAMGTEPWVFAVSPDGRQLAIADDTSIFLKVLGP